LPAAVVVVAILAQVAERVVIVMQQDSLLHLALL
jgi:hypothetical protein